MLIDWKSLLPAVRGSVMVLAEASPETVGAYRGHLRGPLKQGLTDSAGGNGRLSVVFELDLLTRERLAAAFTADASRRKR